MNKEISFYPLLAADIGIDAAVILSYLYDYSPYIGGEFITICDLTNEKMRNLFPFMTDKKRYNAIKKLISIGAVESKKKYDDPMIRTLEYVITLDGVKYVEGRRNEIL